jgi:hypothetical protein
MKEIVTDFRGESKIAPILESVQRSLKPEKQAARSSSTIAKQLFNLPAREFG